MKKIDVNYFPGWTRKSVTFTIDDGNFEMDKKLLDIVRPAGILGTFNIQHWDRKPPELYRELYRGYEIANHCKNHALVMKDGVEYKFSDEPFDAASSDINYLYKIKEGVYYIHIYTHWGKNTGTYDPPRGWHTIAPIEDYKRFADETKAGLEEVFGKGSVRGFAWPHGQGSAEAREYLKAQGYQNIRKTGDIRDTTNFDMPEDRFNWTYNAHDATLLEVAELYERYPDDGRLKFFSFGVHAVDFERGNRWGDLQLFADKYGNRPEDYYYASVGDILAYEDAVKSVEITDDRIINRTDLTLYIKVDGERMVLEPKSFVYI